MSQYAAELCKLLITDNFGELYALIFSYLLYHGRQPLPRIVQNTRLSPRQVRHGLAVLIQQRLIYHYTSLDDGIAYYEASWMTAYNLVRSGRILQLVEEKLGKYVAKVLSTILYHGHVRISYLETLPELRPQVSNKAGKLAAANGLNGIHNDEEEEEDAHVTDQGEQEEYASGGPENSVDSDYGKRSASQLHPALRSLAAYGYIMRVRDAHFQSPADLVEDAERAVSSRSDVRGLKGKKFQEAIDAGVETYIKEKTDGTIPQGPLAGALSRGIKRRAGQSATNSSSKRVKLEHLPEGDEDADDDDFYGDDYVDGDNTLMDPNMIISVNYQKFEVALRNRRLARLAEQCTSRVTSQVYEALLGRIELKTPACRKQPERVPEGEENEQYSVAIPLHTILDDIDPDLDLSESMAGVDPANLLSNGHMGLNGDGDGDDDDDEGTGASTGIWNRRRNRVYELEQHLSLLAQEPNIFSTRNMQSGMIAWAVEFRHLARRLRHLEIERIIESRFGTIAVRVIRVLAAKGKLDEKRLQEISLMASKELRQVLARMEAAGFVDLQEVPRDAQRQPSRTMYLWFFDPDRVARMVLEDTYKCMSRCLQRIGVERNKLKLFLEKTERTDVKGNEEKYLSPAELKTLKEWRDKEALLLGEVGRLDELVSVLRDY
ncbi:RNA polymerase III subunit Rpc82 [Histoplasma capsulatum G186AR]|uniref:DNA-directed RNA polymerase III subunit RPC3 n=1 Tax=Ajellomyces capsulatus TaxID=5037 RepID=A0A8H7YRK4_AJECA|nr:RNA polymerase III subunit Rpc82 [Histoplasma capsulatum]QSS73954.1 RNA polymerase III subunit Rpc82 [Histoplasma capsulatum G186AR]